MPKKLHYNTVSPLLRDILSQLMELPEFAPFCLVGGTSLSLQLGHRISIDIDLFTEAPYGTLDSMLSNPNCTVCFPTAKATVVRV